jgi:hypothetical protein
VSGIVGEELLGGLEGKDGEAADRSNLPRHDELRRRPLLLSGVPAGAQCRDPWTHELLPDAHVCHWTLGTLPASL